VVTGFGRVEVAARHLRVLLQDDRTAGAHHQAGHALVQREWSPGLAAGVEIDLLVIGVRLLVDQAQGAAGAVQQLDSTAQDALQQWLEPELTGQRVRERRQSVQRAVPPVLVSHLVHSS